MYFTRRIEFYCCSHDCGETVDGLYMYGLVGGYAGIWEMLSLGLGHTELSDLREIAGRDTA